jgi:hypothetical protein
VRVLLDQVIDTDYGQLDLVWDEEAGFDGDWDRFFAAQVNGLAGAADPDGLYLNLARRSGGSQVRVELHEGEPADSAEWEDVVEVSVDVPATVDRVGWMTWAGEDGGALDLPPGAYRVRVGARGRDAGAEDEFADEVVDFYVIQLWPSPPRPDEILRTTSANAAYWHGDVGRRR